MEPRAEEGVPPTLPPSDAADSGAMPTGTDPGMPGDGRHCLSPTGIEALIALRRERSSLQPAEAGGVPASESNREGQLTAAHREALVREYGEDSVGRVAADAQELFARLDTERDGRLTLSEFAQALGQLGGTSAAEERGASHSTSL